MTDPATTLYYALSTLAQCAAALAALIGFLGLWRLDRLREEQDQIMQLFRLVVEPGINPKIRDTLIRYGHEHYVQEVRKIVEAQPRGEDGQASPSTLARALARWDALPGVQCWLLWALRGFLVVTLIILGVAVVSFLYVDQAKSWAWTPRLLWIAGLCLAGGPIVVVWTAARSTRTLCLLALLLGLISPALAWAAPPIPGAPGHCTTTYDALLARWETVCDDGTRAITRQNTLLDRDETTIMSGPRRDCTEQRNPLTRQVEVRCR